MSRGATLTPEQIRDAIVACWLRHDRDDGPDLSEIAAELGVPQSRVTAVLRATTPLHGFGDNKTHGGIDESCVPGCKTIPRESAGHSRGSYPTRWLPDRLWLRALLRGEGNGDHRWRVAMRLVLMDRSASTPSMTTEIKAPTADAARTEARRLATERYGALHSNTTFAVTWLGRDDGASEPEKCRACGGTGTANYDRDGEPCQSRACDYCQGEGTPRR